MLHKQLKTKKKTKMPDRACANGLQLHDIPQDLQHTAIAEKSDFSTNPIHNNTSHEMIRWSLCHYKVNGPPVNVPVTLDGIIDILPCMASVLQLHPVKLKCKLEYKSHYMYDMIYRDHVISAITWLKQHNSHYSDIKLNEPLGIVALLLENCQTNLMKVIILSQLMRMQF